MPLCTIAANILFEVVSVRKYPQYSSTGEIDGNQKTEIHKQIGGLMVSKISKQSRNAFDCMVVSALIGLTAVTIYSNYFFVINSIHSIASSALFSILSIVGTSIVTEDKDKNLKDFREAQFIYVWISIWMMGCAYVLYQDFMILWAGKQLILPPISVALFTIYGFMMSVGDVKALYIDANGLWWQKRVFSIAEAILNLVLNIVLGWIWGINGIILASILAVFFSNWIYGPYVLFKYGFSPRDAKDYLIKLVVYSIEFAMVCFVSEKICAIIPLQSWFLYSCKIFVVSIIVIILLLLNYRYHDDAKPAFSLLRKAFIQ